MFFKDFNSRLVTKSTAKMYLVKQQFWGVSGKILTTNGNNKSFSSFLLFFLSAIKPPARGLFALALQIFGNLFAMGMAF